jgi:hypothetical protein
MQGSTEPISTLVSESKTYPLNPLRSQLYGLGP